METARISEARRKAIAVAARPAIVEAGKAIGSKVEDACAHAQAAITGQLVSAEDGRPTKVAADRSRSMKAALARLDELADALVDALQDAWEASYRDAWGHARATIDDDLLDPTAGDEPPASGVRAARSMVLEGRAARDLVVPAIDQAKRTLSAAVPAVATPTVRKSDRRSALVAWQRSASASIARAFALAAYTGAYRADAQAQRDAIDPALLEDSPGA